MTDIFDSKQAVNLLRGKTVLFLGASVTRGLYKDLIWLLNSNTLLPRQILGQKGEASFPDFSRGGEEYEYKFKFKDQLQEDFFGDKHYYHNHNENRKLIHVCRTQSWPRLQGDQRIYQC